MNMYALEIHNNEQLINVYLIILITVYEVVHVNDSKFHPDIYCTFKIFVIQNTDYIFPPRTFLPETLHIALTLPECSYKIFLILWLNNLRSQPYTYKMFWILRLTDLRLQPYTYKIFRILQLIDLRSQPYTYKISRIL